MAEALANATAFVGIDIGKNSFHVVCLDRSGAIVLRQKWSRGPVEARFANMPPCLVGMEACVGAHHLSRRLKALGHDARLMPAKYVRPYSKGQKNDFRDAEAIAEAVALAHAAVLVDEAADQPHLQALRIGHGSGWSARAPASGSIRSAPSCANARPEMVHREGLGDEARQAQRAPQGQGCSRAQARGHSASHVDRRNRVQLVKEGNCCLANENTEFLPNGRKRRPCGNDGDGEFDRFCASVPRGRPRLQH